MSQTTSNTALRDDEIIALYFARDERAIRETEKNYGRACMKVSMDILSSRPDAEECINDTYLKAWNTIPPIRPSSLCAYVLRIARNLSISRLRKLRATKRDRGATLSLSELEECLPSREYESAELAAALGRFIDSLNETDRRLFLGRYWYNLSVKELAAEWDMRPNAVTKHLSRIRVRLRTELEEGGFSV